MPTQIVRPLRTRKHLDGPDFIDEEGNRISWCTCGKDYAPDIPMEDHRNAWKASRPARIKELRGALRQGIVALGVIELQPSVDMQRLRDEYIGDLLLSLLLD